MYAIQINDKNGNNGFLPTLNDSSKIMIFDAIEDAEENLAICKRVAEKDRLLHELETTFEIVEYE